MNNNNFIDIIDNFENDDLENDKENISTDNESEFSDYIMEGDNIEEYDNDSNYSIFEMNGNGNEIEAYNNNLFKENEDINNLIYKLKYKRYKSLYNRLKQVEEIIYKSNFDKSILENSKEITDELINKILGI